MLLHPPCDSVDFSCRLCGVLHHSLRNGLPEGHRSCGSDHLGRGGQSLWAAEGVPRKKNQPVFQTGCKMLQVQPEVDKMVSRSFLSFISYPRFPVSQRGGVVCLCRVFVVVVLALFVTWLVLDTSKRSEQFTSFGGICLLILLVFLFSAHRTAVSPTLRVWSWWRLFWNT